MIMPLILVAIWTTAITCICYFVKDISQDKVLLTVLGFVVGLSLSFRSSTAYERYSEGRRYWAQLSLSTQSMARLIWIHADERPEHAKDDLLRKVSLCNLLVSFSYALKHKLRFEPFTHYEDLQTRIRHVKTLAHEANKKEPSQPSLWKVVGWVLGLPMADSNPRKLIKYSKEPLGNVPLEILGYIGAIIKEMIDEGTMKSPAYQTQAMTYLNQMNDILTGTDRVLNTPLPIAYSIAITQITWVYILLLPLQLYGSLQWVTIPATLFAAYIILGMAMIGAEIENPFGDDVNDLPLDSFCGQISQEMDIIMSHTPPSAADFIKREDNKLLFPLNLQGYESVSKMSVEKIREHLKAKTGLALKTKVEEPDILQASTLLFPIQSHASQSTLRR